jgi:hypothetical protein
LYYFRLEDQIPENHLLRLIDKHASFVLRIISRRKSPQISTAGINESESIG